MKQRAKYVLDQVTGTIRSPPRSRNFDFWQRWLFVASLAFAIFGVVAALWPFAPLFAMRNAAIAETFLGGQWSAESLTYHAFASGPLGGTIAGYYVLQAFIAAIPFRRGEAWAWHAILWATVLWFVLDSGVSLRHGAAFNVYMVNIVPVAVFGLPLAATWRMIVPRG
jgi:hypothetical protein